MPLLLKIVGGVWAVIGAANIIGRFCGFHYQDLSDFRAISVRQHWLTNPNREAAGAVGGG